MSLQVHTWERSLLSMAHEAWHSHRPLATPTIENKALMRRAYAHCSSLTSRHSRSFFVASALLPPAKRQAARALYAFCRVSDDLVDCPADNANAEQNLQRWHQHVLSLHPPQDDLVAVAWADTRACYQIPQGYIDQLLAGVARDLKQKRYQHFDDLVTYAYGVASTVGLMSMHIIGYTSDEAIRYAVKLGVALQLTNILRDVGEDWRAGRVYLPQEELADFGLDEGDLAAGYVSDRWQAFMRFQIERNRRLYAEAWPGIAMLNPDGRFAIAAAAELYRAILDDIEAHDYDVFNRRAHVNGKGKLLHLAKIWRRGATNNA